MPLRTQLGHPLDPPPPLPPPPVPQLGELHQTELWLKTKKLSDLSAEDMRQVKQRGFSDAQIARCLGSDMMAGGRHDGCLGADMMAGGGGGRRRRRWGGSLGMGKAAPVQHCACQTP